jgi:superoxide reductase
MKRRDLIKNAGILGLAGISASAILACKDTTPPVTPAPEAVVEPEKSEKEKLIINRQKMSFKDPENPTDFEWKHTPDIQLGVTNDKGFTEIDIVVGSKNIIHPTEANHWIDYAMLYADEELLGVMNFELGRTGGFTSFKAKLDGVKVLRAEIGCNLHGIWESSLEL